MAKGTATPAKIAEQRKNAEKLKGGEQAAFNFDSAAMEAEIAAVREKHLSGAKSRLDELTAQRDDIEAEIEKIREVLGYGSAPKGGGSAGGGKRTRMSGAEKAAAMAKIEKFVNGQKGEIALGDIVKEMAPIKKAAVTGILRELVKAGKVGTNGKAKAASRYVAA